MRYLGELDFGLSALRRGGFTVRTSLAEQRRARHWIAHLGHARRRMLLRALHRGMRLVIHDNQDNARSTRGAYTSPRNGSRASHHAPTANR